MLFHLRHRTRFGYSSHVFCEPMVVRLRPRDDAAQRLLSYRLDITPEPAGRSDYQDLDGNVATRIWFAEMIDYLELQTSAVVETLRTNAFDYLLEAEALRLPMTYDEGVRSALASYSAPPTQMPQVEQLAREVAEEAQGETVPFLLRLAARIRETCQTKIREHGAPWTAERTLAERTGSCRDLAVVFNEACRMHGIAARFVSGYQRDELDGGSAQLHAWSEVYLPGAGWRGFDPAHGLAVTDRHVAVAAAANHADAAPTVGTFRGTNVRSTLTAEIEIEIGSVAGA